MTGGADLSFLADVVARTDARLSSFFADKRSLARATSPVAIELVDAVSALTMRGGKRLRPAALVAGYCAAAASGAELACTVDASAALELLQSYFLIQDDFMDGDEERRGGPAVHAALTRAHHDAHVGASLAILAADLASGFAWELVAAAPFAAHRLREALGAFGQMHFEVVCGQHLDVLGHDDVGLVHDLKTGSYTVRGPLRLGALLADAGTVQLEVLERFGEPLGLAFQLRDDLLGVFGTPASVGKPVGGDLRAGKRTSLLAEARGALGPEDAARVDAVLGNASATAEQMAVAIDALARSGARERLQARIEGLLAEALSALDGAPLQPGGVAMLRTLAEKLLRRDR